MDQGEDIDAGWTESELSVLRSAELDQPGVGSVERTLTILGIGAALGAGLSAAPRASLPGAGSWAKRLLKFKFLGPALVLGGVVSAVLATRQRPAKLAAVAPLAGVSTPAVVSATVEAPPVLDAPVPVVASGAPLVPARGVAPVKRDVGKAALAEEIRMIDEARVRLRRGDARGSLETLERYERMVQHGGSMRAEATVVRIEALQATGDTASAALLGQRFLAKNPSSPYAESVTRILARKR